VIMNSLREVRGLLADNVTSCFALLAVLVLAGGSPARADDAPLMAVKIFNDDPVHWIYPVLTTGKGDQDIWLQAFFKVEKLSDLYQPVGCWNRARTEC